MISLPRALIAIAGLLTASLAAGFVHFAASATAPAERHSDAAEGIVVLTGGELRIREGAWLLRQGRAKRLLISGVNRVTTRQDLMRLAGLRGEQFNCCVDIGYRARNTVGNADETRDWVREKGFRSLIVVTSSYHMPRSLAELALVLPDVTLLPHPVLPAKLRAEPWWQNSATARMLVGEYLKYLPAVTRLAMDRIARTWDNRSIAAGPPRHGTSS
jgi:uncharacterized SAM-binding protein YcdF (DUF218 family)